MIVLFPSLVTRSIFVLHSELAEPPRPNFIQGLNGKWRTCPLSCVAPGVIKRIQVNPISRGTLLLTLSKSQSVQGSTRYETASKVSYQTTVDFAQKDSIKRSIETKSRLREKNPPSYSLEQKLCKAAPKFKTEQKTEK